LINPRNPGSSEPSGFQLRVVFRNKPEWVERLVASTIGNTLAERFPGKLGELTKKDWLSPGQGTSVLSPGGFFCYFPLNMLGRMRLSISGNGSPSTGKLLYSNVLNPIFQQL